MKLQQLYCGASLKHNCKKKYTHGTHELLIQYFYGNLQLSLNLDIYVTYMLFNKNFRRETSSDCYGDETFRGSFC